MTIMTNYFESLAKAIHYYDKYMFIDTASVVRNKCKTGEVVIGIPSVRASETLILNNDGRYSVLTRGYKLC